MNFPYIYEITMIIVFSMAEKKLMIKKNKEQNIKRRKANLFFLKNMYKLKKIEKKEKKNSKIANATAPLNIAICLSSKKFL